MNSIHDRIVGFLYQIKLETSKWEEKNYANKKIEMDSLMVCLD